MKRYILCAAAIFCAGAAAAADSPAKLLSFANDVLYRRAGSSDWGKVSLGMDLYRRDTLYTMAASRAEVRFLTGETLSLTPNTLVVLRPPGGSGADAVMLAGELRSARSRVVTRTAVIVPKSRDAEFNTRMKADLTTVVSVTRGVAEVEAQGRKVEVRKGFVTEVRLNMAPSAPVAMGAPPAPPRAPAAPERGAALPAGDGPEAVLPADALASVQAVRGYRLQVAKDRGFSEPVLDRTYDTLDRPVLEGLLPPGDYFMRAAKIDLLGYEGKFSAPKPVRVGQ